MPWEYISRESKSFTQILHSKNKLLSLSYLLSIWNSPVPSIYKLSCNKNPSVEGGMWCSYQVLFSKRKITKQWFPKLAHQTHMGVLFHNRQFLGTTPWEPALIGCYGGWQEPTNLTSPSSRWRRSRSGFGSRGSEKHGKGRLDRAHLHQQNYRCTGTLYWTTHKILVTQLPWNESGWPKKAKPHIQPDPRAKEILQQTSWALRPLAWQYWGMLGQNAGHI